MANPIANLQRSAAEYQKMSKKDQKRYVTDLILNNALYILMLAFCIYTAIQRPNFLSLGSLGNLIVQVAAYLPMALPIRPKPMMPIVLPASSIWGVSQKQKSLLSHQRPA